ncbi:hypothetical protein J2X71_000259 [Rhizobium sp. 1399]|nr:hypothetical protein [Rhizobium sp. 1399]
MKVPVFTGTRRLPTSARFNSMTEGMLMLNGISKILTECSSGVANYPHETGTLRGPRPLPQAAACLVEMQGEASFADP